MAEEPFRITSVSPNPWPCCTRDCCNEREMAEAECVDLRAEADRLRALVQAFEEDHARLVAAGDHLRVLLNSRRDRKAHKVPAPLRVVEQHAEDEWLAVRNREVNGG